MTHAETLRGLLARDEPLILPGAGSPMDAYLAAQTGFDALYVSGWACAMMRYGLPDIGLVGLREQADLVGAMTRVADIPLIVDADTGYGDVVSVRHTVRTLESLGAAAIQIEDQVWPKRCGHMDDKAVEPFEVALRKIRAAIASKQDRNTVIVARSDAAGPHGLDEAIRRCAAFREAGADLLFVDGPGSVEDLKHIAANLDGPLFANMSEGGKTPTLSAKELYEIGFQAIMWPSTSSRVAMRQVSEFYAELKRTGDSRPWFDRMAMLPDAHKMIGLDEHRAFEQAMLKGD